MHPSIGQYSASSVHPSSSFSAICPAWSSSRWEPILLEAAAVRGLGRRRWRAVVQSIKRTRARAIESPGLTPADMLESARPPSNPKNVKSNETA